MCSIRKDQCFQLSDNKTNKKKVWDAFAKKMESHSYDLGDDSSITETKME